MSSSNSPDTMLPMRREQAGSVTFCRYGKARRRRWINWNASGRLFKPFLLIPRFSFTVLLVAEGRPPLARLIGLCRVRPQPKRSSPLKKPVPGLGDTGAESCAWRVRGASESRGATKRKRRHDMMPNQLREKPGRLVLVAGVLREFRRL